MSRVEPGMNSAMRWTLALCGLAVIATVGWILSRRPKPFDTSQLSALRPIEHHVDDWSEEFVFPEAMQGRVAATLRRQCRAGDGWIETPVPSGYPSFPSPTSPPSPATVAAAAPKPASGWGAGSMRSAAASAIPAPPVPLTSFYQRSLGRSEYVEVSADKLKKTVIVRVQR